MSNLSKVRREQMIDFLEKIKEMHNDDDSLIALNQIESEIVSKRYGLVWEEHEENVDLMMRDNIPVFTEDSEREICEAPGEVYNFILEGDNLHSLNLLAKTHKGKVDVIYIDPPYNTGAKDWKYNNDYVEKTDSYRHSKWLSMMAARMTIAKKLLKDDGVFVCAIDENELGTTLLLIEEIFGEGYKADPITVIHNPRGVQGDNFSYVNEYAIFVYKKGYKVVGERIVEEDEIDWSPLRNWGSESERKDARNCFYPIYVKDDEIIGFGEVTPNEIHPKQTEYDKKTDTYAVYPIDVKGVERKWRYARQTVETILHLLRAKKTKEGYDIELGKNYAPYKTVWTDKKYDANEYGTQLIGSMIPDNEFTFPKSLYNVYDCLYAVLRDRKDAVVLDYFAGSGTTGHAVLLLNKNLNSNHRFILCTNNDVGEEREKEFKSKIGSVDDHMKEWLKWRDKYGIASSVTYPRIASAIKGFVHKKDFKNVVFQKRITPALLRNSGKAMEEVDDIIKKYKKEYDEVKMDIDGDTLVVIGISRKGKTIKGIPANLKYYHTEFISKNDEDLMSALLEHIAEMIEIENGIKLDDKRYAIILDDEAADELEKKWKKHSEIRAIYVSQDVLLTTEQEKLFQNVELHMIPEHYFDYELREVGELW